MRAFLRGRASQILLWGALIVTAVSSRGTVVIEAQEPAMRWDGLIELISGRYDYPPPTTTPPNPADGPSEMTRHAVSGDGLPGLAPADQLDELTDLWRRGLLTRALFERQRDVVLQAWTRRRN